MPAFDTQKSRNKLAHPSPGDKVVITGVAGLFPDSDNVLAFQENILNKADLTSDDERRWKNGRFNFVHFLKAALPLENNNIV